MATVFLERAFVLRRKESVAGCENKRASASGNCTTRDGFGMKFDASDVWTAIQLFSLHNRFSRQSGYSTVFFFCETQNYGKKSFSRIL